MWKVFPGSTVASYTGDTDQNSEKVCCANKSIAQHESWHRKIKCLKTEEQTSMLVALSFSSITCFRMVRDDLMASFSVMDCHLFFLNETKKTQWLFNSDLYVFNFNNITTYACSVWHLVVDLLQRALRSLRCWADGPCVTLHKRPWWVHVIPAVTDKTLLTLSSQTWGENG